MFLNQIFYFKKSLYNKILIDFFVCELIEF
jgi:hypothetical protein